MRGLKLIMIIIILLFILLSFLLIMEIRINSTCEKECFGEGGHFHDVIKSGSWKLDDLCVCYADDEIKYWRMGNK